jgi:hypothetical protein
MDIVFQCKKCGNTHIGLPAFGFRRPASYLLAVSGGGDIRESDDLCIIGGSIFLVRAVLELPIAGHAGKFEWGPWGSLSEENFHRYEGTFDDPQQSRLGPMFSYLDNDLPGYPGSLGLRCALRTCPEISAPPGLFSCPPAAAQKELHILDMRPFLRFAAGQDSGAIQFTYFRTGPYAQRRWPAAIAPFAGRPGSPARARSAQRHLT